MNLFVQSYSLTVLPPWGKWIRSEGAPGGNLSREPRAPPSARGWRPPGESAPPRSLAGQAWAAAVALRALRANRLESRRGPGVRRCHLLEQTSPVPSFRFRLPLGLSVGPQLTHNSHGHYRMRGVDEKNLA